METETKLYPPSDITGASSVPFESGCIKDCLADLPIPSTSVGTKITRTVARIKGRVDIKGIDMIVHGICWSTTPHPHFYLSTMTYCPWSGSEWTSRCTGLIPGSTYYARTYYITLKGIIYGPEMSFTTPAVRKFRFSQIAEILYNMIFTSFRIYPKYTLVSNYIDNIRTKLQYYRLEIFH